MERAEFLQGWLLLTTQPWGKPYRTQLQSDPGTEPSPPEIQAELYWRGVERINPYVWLAVCEAAASDMRHAFHALPAERLQQTKQGFDINTRGCHDGIHERHAAEG